MTDSEIIKLLGGVTAVAKMLKIKPPSVQGWLTSGIPEGRLIELAAQIEIRADGRFSRRARWPDNFAFFWPELANDQTTVAQPEAVVVAMLVPPPLPIDAGQPVTTRSGVRRTHPESPYDHSDIDRRAEEGPTHLGRRFDNGGADKAQGVV